MLGEVDGVACVIVLDLDTKHPVELTKVYDFKGLVQAGNQLLDEPFAACSNCAVIHMDCVTGRLARGQENRQEGRVSVFDPQDW